MKKILITLNIIGIIGSTIWLIYTNDFEPFVTLIGLIGSLITLLRSSNEETNSAITLKQKGGIGSTNYQSNGDININTKK